MVFGFCNLRFNYSCFKQGRSKLRDSVLSSMSLLSILSLKYFVLSTCDSVSLLLNNNAKESSVLRRAL